MVKKISKQREKIEKLLQKKTELDSKLVALENEIAGEEKILQSLEKDYVASYMVEHTLTAEEVIEILSEKQEAPNSEQETSGLDIVDRDIESIDKESELFWG